MPIRFASAQASPSLEAPRLHALETRDLLHQHNRKGKVVIIKTRRYKRLVLGSFFAPETDMILGDGVGASLVWLKEVREMVVTTGLPPVPGTPSQQSRQSAVGSQRSGMDGQTPEGNVPPGFQHTMLQQKPQQQQANVSQNAQRFASTTNLNADGQGCPQGCQQGNMPVMQQGISMVWCTMDSPTTNIYAADSASACTEFWLCEHAWWTKAFWFSKLRSEPDELPRKHAEWHAWSDFGRFDASSSADPRGFGHVR